MSRSSKRRRWILGIVVVGALVGVRCRFTPPVLSSVEADASGTEEHRDPRWSRVERIEVEGPEGAKLRGLFIPSDRDAPVVLHLLESGGSVSVNEGRYAGNNPGEVAFELADLGFASLFLDYRGIGGSDGTIRTAHLADDVHAMWGEALRRAHGDAGRVFVRATSIGTVGAMILLRDGVQPAGLALVAPVDATTVAVHFADAGFGILARWLAEWTLLPVAEDVEPGTRLARSDAPLFVAAGSKDELWPPAEQTGVRDVVAAKRGRFVDESAFTRRLFILGEWHSELQHHISFTIHSKEEMCASERSFWKERGGAIDLPARMARILDGVSPVLRRRFEADSEARRRLELLAAEHVAEEPSVLAFLACCPAHEPETERFLAYCRGRTPEWLDHLGDSMALDVLAFDDPAGDLSSDLTLLAFEFFHRGVNDETTPDPATVATVLERARGVGAEGISAAQRRWRGSEGGRSGGEWGEDFRSEIWEPLETHQRLPPSDAARHLVRILLHGAGIADRVSEAPNGSITLEACDGERWVAVDPAIVFERVESDPAAAPH